MTNLAKKIDITTKSQEFFRDELTVSLKKNGISLHPLAEFYIVNLLCEQVAGTERGSSQSAVTSLLQEPLAVHYKRAEEAEPALQPDLFRRVGDASLVICGFFREFFCKRSFNADYYRDLGCLSYHRASELAARRAKVHAVLVDIYQMVAEQFEMIVMIVNELSDRVATDNYRDLAAVYSRWNKTKSENLLAVLKEQGVRPLRVLG